MLQTVSDEKWFLEIWKHHLKMTLKLFVVEAIKVGMFRTDGNEIENLGSFL